MSRANEVFLNRAAQAVAHAARAHVKPKIRDGVAGGHGSRHLSKNVEILPDTRGARAGKTRLYIDHYWAIYVHDGRDAMTKDDGVFVWYKDRRQDPRLASTGGYPKRFRQVGKRIPSFKADREAGKLVFRKSVGPVDPSPFFSNAGGGGMSGFLSHKGRPIVLARWATHINQRLKTIRKIKRTVVITLA